MVEPVTGYHPPWWYRGRHLQTLWGPLFRRFGAPPLRRERVHTADGDFLDVDWLARAPAGAPLVLVLHGLEGSSRSHYVAGLLREAAALGLRALVLNFRSCGGELNRAPRLYHSARRPISTRSSSGSSSASRRCPSGWWAYRSGAMWPSSGWASEAR